MGWGEWILAGLVALGFVFVILRPDLWGRRDGRSGDGTAVGGGFDGRRRDDDDDADFDGDGGDGGGGD